MNIVRLVVGRFALGVAALVAVAGSVAGCGGSSGAKPTPRCVHDSDCSGLLVCVDNYCVSKCTTSKDCSSGDRCIEATGGTSCEAPEKATCHYNSDCEQPLVCSGDLVCRSQCKTAADCPSGQVCTTTSKLCADPTVDKNYNSATMEFTGGNAAFGAGIEQPDAGTGDTSDAPVDGSSAAGDHPAGSTDGSGGADESTDGVAYDGPTQPEVGIATTCPGTPLTLFSKIATGDMSSYYGSGVGVRLATEMVIFDGYSGPDTSPVDGGADAGDASGDAAAPRPWVNRIDVQHFDLTGVSKGPATQLMVVEGDLSGVTSGVPMLVNAAAAAPTGQVAIVYTAGNNVAAGIYLALLPPGALASTQPSIQLQGVGGTHYGHQAHVQWEDGQFVASWVSYDNGSHFLNMSKFDKDGNPTGGASAIATDATGLANGQDLEQGSVAISGGTFAVAYSTPSAYDPSLSFVDRNGVAVGATQVMPYSQSGAPDWSRYVVVGATTKGFVGLYHGQVTAPDGGAAISQFVTLATFVAPPGGDGGVGGVGATVALSPGASARNSQNGASSSSDLTGAGFAILAPDGKASFAYFSGDGTTHLGPTQVLQEAESAVDSDQVELGNNQGSFAMSLYSRTEGRTRMAVSGCPATAN